MKIFTRGGILLGLVASLILPTTLFAQTTPAPSTGALPAGVQRGTCAFKCVPAATPDGAGVTAQRIITCTSAPSDTTCQAMCDTVCLTPGPEGNGLSAAEGTGLRCARTPVPRCVVASAPTPSTATPGSGTTAGQTANTAVELVNPLGTTDLAQLFGRVVQAILGILGALALLWFVWGGVLWMTAAESKRTEEAKSIIKNAALGLVILFFSYGLATAFLGIFEEAARQSTSRSNGVNTNTGVTQTTR